MRPPRLLRNCVLVACSLSRTTLASDGNQEPVATARAVALSGGIGYGLGKSDDLNRFGWGFLARLGYTAINGFHGGIMVEAYRPDTVEYELESKEAYTAAGGVELGYDHRLSKSWVLRLGLVNGVGSFVTTRCDIERSELGSAFDETTCHPPSNEWNYMLGPSAEAHYVWSRGLVYTAVRQTCFLGSSSAFYGVTFVVGFGAVFRDGAKQR